MVRTPPQVTVHVQGQEVLSEKMDPSSFHSLPQTPEPGPKILPEAMQQSPLGLQVKEEPDVTEDPGEGGQGPGPGWVDQGGLD